MSKILDKNLFTRFLSICAGHIGQSINYSSLANDTGVSVTTAQIWISILETSFIPYREVILSKFLNDVDVHV